MPVSKNALIRYKTIDNCLRNRYRKWTLEDLIDACSDALSEFEGRDENVSRRTVQADIQMMRSDKLGYNAPIVVKENKYYTYADPDYSITNVPLTEQDTAMMADAVNVLKQLSGFSAFAVAVKMDSDFLCVRVFLQIIHKGNRDFHKFLIFVR